MKAKAEVLMVRLEIRDSIDTTMSKLYKPGDVVDADELMAVAARLSMTMIKDNKKLTIETKKGIIHLTARLLEGTDDSPSTS